MRRVLGTSSLFFSGICMSSPLHYLISLKINLMKKLPLLFVFLFFCHSALRAQPILNGGFETWSFQTYYENPIGFWTTNFSSYLINRTANVNKISPGFNSASAISLVSVNNSPDVLPGFAFFDNPSIDPSTGIPYTGSPDSLKGFFQSNIQPGDTGNVLVIIRGGGAALAIAQKQFTGQTNTWTPFGVSFIWLDTITPPDTLAMILTSSSFNGSAAIIGSRLDLDQLQLIGPNADPLPNGDFEAWIPSGNDEPENWSTLNFICNPLDLSVTPSTDAFAGSGALQLKTVTTLFDDTLGLITNGYFTNEPEGGMPISQNPISISGYYKYFPQGPDSALVGAYTYFYNPSTQSRTVLDSSLIFLTPTSTYQSFTLPFLYNGWNLPDTLQITFSSSNILNANSYVGIGSTLLIDELSIQYSPVGEPRPLFGNTPAPYPMPASSWLNIPLDKTLHGNTIEIFDATGKNVFRSTINGTNLQLDVHQWNDGVYFYRCPGERSMLKGQFIIQH